MEVTEWKANGTIRNRGCLWSTATAPSHVAVALPFPAVSQEEQPSHSTTSVMGPLATPITPDSPVSEPRRLASHPLTA